MILRNFLNLDIKKAEKVIGKELSTTINMQVNVWLSVISGRKSKYISVESDDISQKMKPKMYHSLYILVDDSSTGLVSSKHGPVCAVPLMFRATTKFGKTNDIEITTLFLTKNSELVRL